MKKMDVLVLSGGKGQRLEPRRKKISSKYLPTLSVYEGQEGPKGLTMLHMANCHRPLLDWHLSLYRGYQCINRIFLGLGFAARMIQDYYAAQGNLFDGLPLFFLCEKNPAGTIAPLIKLKKQYGLPRGPLLIANGDNLININFDALLAEVSRRMESHTERNAFVFDVVVSVPHEESDKYGVVDMDETGTWARQFLEKQDWQKNPFTIIDGQPYSYVNTGFSVIPKPDIALKDYLTPEIEQIVQALEEGILDYKIYEKQVKYETMYEKMAAKGHLAVVKYNGFWADSGSEALIQQIEQQTQAGVGLHTKPPQNTV